LTVIRIDLLLAAATESAVVKKKNDGFGRGFNNTFPLL
jgi:hypothetical protein